jgi:galactokinase
VTDGGGRTAVVDRATALHRQAFGVEAAARAVAPGRINIIGEHTDYAGGLCLPAAVDRHLAVAVSPADGVELVSEQRPGERVAVPARDLHAGGGWADLPLGVIAELQREGLGGGVRLAIASDIPAGSGLSSSAALGVASAMAALAMLGRELEPLDVARICRRAENDFLGVPSGLMDQAAVTMGRAGCALLFNAAADIVEPVELPSSVAWLVVDSGIERSLRESAYPERRAEAQQALDLARRQLGMLRSLCELDPADVEALGLPPPLDRRARHIAGECKRVLMAVACIEADNLAALGQLVHTSHRSLSRDYEVSLPELDGLVALAMDAGCAGARVMGAGFGGSVLALVSAADTDAVAARIARGMPPSDAGAARVMRVTVVEGAATVP